MARRSLLLLPCLFAAAAVLCDAHSKLAKKSNDVVNGPLLTTKIDAKRTLIVGPNDEFKTIQSAIDAVPEGNTEWVIVHIRSGVYTEKVVIQETKPFIFVRGNGKGRTSISFESASPHNAESATFAVHADNVIVFGLSFRNAARAGLPNSPEIRTVAAMVGGDKVAFYHCAFYSPHHTLFDQAGRHYYESCYIQGNIDFIFGGGQSIFQCAEIFVKPDRRTEILGSITASDRKEESAAGGFVFLKGKVYGVGEVYLGRANEAYSRVVFADTYLSKTINPAGWTDYGYTGSKDNLMLAEFNCTGPGADASKRVPWSRQLSPADAAKFLTVDFIDGKDWLPAFYY
ncbi:probable pectinesterase 67 [Lolium rigidum]|uniref:probable pectinesterase 67 n=1 Tax=Lolium rigidum TaxID=89674 RepID=UPI001F5D458C|nr:probable pectinesterase 67 [Lolium rigidum]